MTVPASRIAQYIDPKSSQLIELRGVSGTLIRKLTVREALNLVDADSVMGICSPSRLKYLKLVSRDVPQEILRQPSAREFLRRMVSARKFSYREHLQEPCPISKQQEWSGLTAWKHKNCFE